MSASEGSLGQDEVFEILSSARRRYAISILLQNDEPMALTELAEEIAAIEGDTTVGDLEKQQRKRVYVSLYQTHIPKLADAGVVDYDADSGNVTLARGAQEIDTYLSEGNEQRSWQQFYLGLSLIIGVVLVLNVAGVSLFGMIPAAAVAAVAVIGFGLLGIAQYVLSDNSSYRT